MIHVFLVEKLGENESLGLISPQTVTRGLNALKQSPGG